MLEDLTAALLLKEAVTFRGWVAPTEVERELEDAWALVAPSLWAEPLGLVAIEAIVRGVPVVASASGGLGETVQDGVSGLLFPNGDEAALAERLDAVARGRAFPDHQLPAALVRQVRETHGVAAPIGFRGNRRIGRCATADRHRMIPHVRLLADFGRDATPGSSPLGAGSRHPRRDDVHSGAELSLIAQALIVAARGVPSNIGLTAGRAAPRLIVGNISIG
jgi:hypothetical protein